ncbi:MAG: imidazoleglycerol-phosphate dehydratase HisB [Oscillospiraceae bacterium]|nr:imidazoleglycerol-phosphate dehydratase HisB [Oscillospiraceae bacterium]
MTTIKESKRAAQIERETKETKIRLSLCADAEKPGLRGSSGIGFFDHMLNTFAFHGGFEIALEMSGDLDVDCHHSIEDAGIVLGLAFGEIIGQNKNITRFAHEYVPMDESLAMCSADLGGRAYLVFNAEFANGSIGGYDVQMTKEFFRAMAQNMLATIHINLQYGENNHHKTEAIFKAAAKAIKKALTPAGDYIISAKGVI